jgi:hypothetical protein
MGLLHPAGPEAVAPNFTVLKGPNGSLWMATVMASLRKHEPKQFSCGICTHDFFFFAFP